VDNTLAYVDQASFLGLRALGHGPLDDFTWVYDGAVNIEGLRRFHAHLGHSLLGRRIERSPLPFGRHRWVSSAGPPDVEVAQSAISRDQLLARVATPASLQIDPERGPAWRLLVQPLADGGTGVSLIVSHTVADGLGAIEAITDAANGVRRDLDYPPPRSRTRAQALAEDARVSVRSLPEAGAAALAAVRLARDARADVSASAQRSTPTPMRSAGPLVAVPSTVLRIEAAQWDQRAAALGGAANTLLLGLATHVGALLGRREEDGMVRLNLPLSDRTPHDTRGNALTAMTMAVDPRGVTSDLGPLRRDFRREFDVAKASSYALMAPLPLTPLVPRVVARRLEGMALGAGSPVGCSNLGELDPAINRPDGTDASLLFVRMLEPRTAAMFDRIGGYLMLVALRINGSVTVTVGCWQPGATNSRDQLVVTVRSALDDFGLPGTVE